MRVAGCDNLRLIADVYEVEPNDRPVVFLLHGGGQNRHAWIKTAESLQAAGHSVVAYDTRGHGDSDWDPRGQYETDDLSYDLLAVR